MAGRASVRRARCCGLAALLSRHAACCESLCVCVRVSVCVVAAVGVSNQIGDRELMVCSWTSVFSGLRLCLFKAKLPGSSCEAIVFSKDDRRKFRSQTVRQRTRRKSEEKVKRRARKEMQVRESREQLFFFSMVCGSGGSKSRLAKAAAIQFVGTWHPVLLQPALRRDWHANSWQYNFWQRGSQL